jgi:hypothetical protein
LEFLPSRLPPFRHQAEIFEQTRDLAAWAWLLEQGTGKSRIAIDNASWLFAKGEITGVLIVAPNGVHRNWISDEFPRHLNPDVPYCGWCYQSAKASTKSHQAAVDHVTRFNGLAVLAMSYDAMTTDAGKAAAKRFLVGRRCIYLLDESQRIKNPKTQRTKTILESAKYAPYRRLLSGTPITNGPFDIYSQMKFLDEKFWLPHGFSSFTVFRHVFGIFKRMQNQGTGKSFDQLVAYQNLPLLERIVQAVSSRVLKEDVLDLPPKLFSNRYFSLSPEQTKLYQQLKTDYVAELEGRDIVAGLAIVRLMRLQQITCGYVPIETGEPVTMVGTSNPRLDLLAETVEDITHQGIIWSRFTKDIELICGLLGKAAVRYDGTCSPDERIKSLDAFHAGDAQWFVANPAACSEGLTLTEAKTVIRYTNNFKLAERLQSDDRAHRIGQDRSVQYIDLIAENTIDQQIVRSLLSKFDIASQLNGDTLRQWLTA